MRTYTIRHGMCRLTLKLCWSSFVRWEEDQITLPDGMLIFFFLLPSLSIIKFVCIRMNSVAPSATGHTAMMIHAAYFTHSSKLSLRLLSSEIRTSHTNWPCNRTLHRPNRHCIIVLVYRNIWPTKNVACGMVFCAKLRPRVMPKIRCLNILWNGAEMFAAWNECKTRVSSVLRNSCVMTHSTSSQHLALVLWWVNPFDAKVCSWQ